MCSVYKFGGFLALNALKSISLISVAMKKVNSTFPKTFTCTSETKKEQQ